MAVAGQDTCFGGGLSHAVVVAASAVRPNAIRIVLGEHSDRLTNLYEEKVPQYSRSSLVRLYIKSMGCEILMPSRGWCWVRYYC